MKEGRKDQNNSGAPSNFAPNKMQDYGALYKGRVVHRRLRPKTHFLSYRVFSLLVDLDRLDAMDRDLKFFSRNKFNLFSFYDKDFGTGAPNNIADYMRGSLANEGIVADGVIKLLCYPRMLGYAFNPLSVYYCHNRQGALVAIVYEVSSTFGERHSYLIRVEDDAPVLRQRAAKRLHVSPFMEMAADYHFRLNRPSSKLTLLIRQTDKGGPILHASFTGQREAVSDGALMRAFFAYPLMTVKIIAGIHWEAVKLILKGMRLRSGPKAPACAFSDGCEESPDEQARILAEKKASLA